MKECSLLDIIFFSNVAVMLANNVLHLACACNCIVDVVLVVAVAVAGARQGQGPGEGNIARMCMELASLC
jgi:hypothetical protein